MKTIMESIIQAEEGGCYKNWAQLIVGVVAIARYGENKFPTWAKVIWDHDYLAAEVMWTRLKTRIKHPIYLQTCRET